MFKVGIVRCHVKCLEYDLFNMFKVEIVEKANSDSNSGITGCHA